MFEERVLLLPGYVFFESHEPELSMKLSRQEHVLRLLTYPDGTWHLRGYDDAFARMLFRENGEIGFSQAVFDEETDTDEGSYGYDDADEMEED